MPTLDMTVRAHKGYMKCNGQLAGDEEDDEEEGIIFPGDSLRGGAVSCGRGAPVPRRAV